MVELAGDPGVVGNLDGGDAFGGVHLQHRGEEVETALGDAGADLGTADVDAPLDQFEEFLATLGLEGEVAVQRAEQDHAHRPHVHRRLRGRLLGQHFGRNVLRTA